MIVHGDKLAEAFSYKFALGRIQANGYRLNVRRVIHEADIINVGLAWGLLVLDLSVLLEIGILIERVVLTRH